MDSKSYLPLALAIYKEIGCLTWFYFPETKETKQSPFSQCVLSQDIWRGLPSQLLSLAGLGVVLHADVVGVELVAGDVCEELREVQPPQELHGVRVGALSGDPTGGQPVVEGQGEGQRQGEDRAGVQVSTGASSTPSSAPSATEHPPDQEVLPLRVHVNGRFQEVPERS